jgi:proline iminopeptidase
MEKPIVEEGFIPVPGGKVWYQKVGGSDTIPLITLHGGPAVPHSYIGCFAELADERPVIFYDQLGCGRSDCLVEDKLWTIERFVEELHEVRKALKIDRMHLLGHSWGTMLAMDYYLTHPDGVVSLVLASPCLNFPLWVSTYLPSLLAELPEGLQTTIKNHVPGEMTPDYQAVVEEYNSRYLFHRADLSTVLSAFNGFNFKIRQILFGADDIFPMGRMGQYDRSEDLHKVEVPVLLTCGRYDDSTPDYLEWHHQHLPNSQIAIFEQSGHMTPLDEPEGSNRVVRSFLRQMEAAMR